MKNKTIVKGKNLFMENRKKKKHLYRSSPNKLEGEKVLQSGEENKPRP